MPELIWTARAAADLQQLGDRYDDYAEGVSERLADEVDRALKLVQAFPDACRQIHPAGFRRALLADRKLGLIYRSEPRGIIVHAIRDLRGDPSGLMRLLEELARGLPPAK